MTRNTQTPPSVLAVLAATMLLQSVAAMCLTALPAVAPAVAVDLGISPAYVGVFIALVYAAGMFTSLASGALVARLGALRVCQLGLLLCAVGLALCAIPHPSAAACGALLMGLGYGPITPSGSHLLARGSAARRMSLVFSIKQTGVPLGGALAGAIIPGLALAISWRGAFLALAVAGVACCLVVQPWRGRFDSDRHPGQPISLGNGLTGPVRLVFSHRSLTVLAVVSFLFSVVQLSLTSYLVTYLQVDLGTTLVVAGFMMTVAQGAGVAGRLLWGYVADRTASPVGTLSVLAFLIAVCSLTIPFLTADALWWMPTLFAVFGGCSLGWNGVYLAEVARQAPADQVSAATGGANSLTFLGDVLGPPIFGLAASLAGSYGEAFALLGLPSLVCLALLAGSRSAFRRTQPVGGSATGR